MGLHFKDDPSLAPPCCLLSLMIQKEVYLSLGLLVLDNRIAEIEFA